MKMRDFRKQMRCIIFNVNSYIGSKIEKHGIKHGQYEYFLLIYSMPGINQIELSKMKNVGKASVTKALKILENDGLIKRVIDENDRRNILCYITEKGETIVDDLFDIRSKVESVIFEGLDDKDKIMLFKYLSQICLNSEKLVADIDEGEA